MERLHAMKVTREPKNKNAVIYHSKVTKLSTITIVVFATKVHDPFYDIVNFTDALALSLLPQPLVMVQ